MVGPKKSLKKSTKKATLGGLAVCLGVFFLGGCGYNFAVHKSSTLNLPLATYQPLAILPIGDAAGYPESGYSLYESLQKVLAEKGYQVIHPSRIIYALAELGLPPEIPSPDAATLGRLNRRLQAGVFWAGMILDLKFQKSSFTSRTFEARDSWEGNLETQELPTYLPRLCRMKIDLRLLSEEGKDLWKAQGQGSGPSCAKVGEGLIRRLLQDVPNLRSSSQK